MRPNSPHSAPAEGENEKVATVQGARLRLLGITRHPLARELLILLAYCFFTALLTWPYVTRLRDAVADSGDPYLVAWILWWDYHATFTDPLNLFHSNVFYPFRYTLAFSEHCYGLALLFFPLFALGARPLTAHAVALFFGFALSGYGAFRLARTLTGSDGVAWVAGIVFAFVPYRFNLMSHLPYLFSPWIPLLFEALVLFARAQTRPRAAWLGCALFMTGLTTVTWFALSLFPFALCAAVLLTRYQLWRARDFWVRGIMVVCAAGAALLPFMLPYYWVSKLYGFQRSIAEIEFYSAWPIHWFCAENRNKLWHGMGVGIPDGDKFKLFPGLLPLLLSLAALLLVAPLERRHAAAVLDQDAPRKRWLGGLDALVVIALVISVFAIGFRGTDFFGGLFRYVTSERALGLLTVAVLARLCLAYPAFVRRSEDANLIETLRSERRGDAFWLGLVLTVVGFCYSLGWNFFFYRILYDLLPIFKSMRVPIRGAMFAYLGLALLAGLGAKRLADMAAHKRPRHGAAAVYGAVCALLLLELNGAPLQFTRGDVFPDAVTLRLRETPMRGGIVVLPAGAYFNHRHMLRAADHARPLVVGTSGFNSPYEDEIEELTRAGSIPLRFLELLEQIPASYLVIETHLIVPERRADYETFIARAVAAGRLRFINRFDGRADLYAVVQTEPEARSEAELPFALPQGDWAARVADDPANLLGRYQHWSQRLYRIHLASYGQLPRYPGFVADVRALGRGVTLGFGEEEQQQLENNLREFVQAWADSPLFRAAHDRLSDAQYVDRLFANAGVVPDASRRATLINSLKSGDATRASVLLQVVDESRFVEKERYRSLVLLHFFGYLRRNPDDPPDGNMRGLYHWLGVLERGGDPASLSQAFANSDEYRNLSGRAR